MVALSFHILESCIPHYMWCDCVFIAYRIAEWTIEVMKAARTSIFEPEVSYFHSAHVITFLILSASVACGRYTIDVVDYLAWFPSFPPLFLRSVSNQKLDSGEGLVVTAAAVFVLQFLQEDSVGKNAQTSGLSWVKPGTFEPFTREDT